MSGPNDQHIYIDTFYLQSFLNGNNDLERHAKKEFRKAKQLTEKSGEIFLKIPFIAVAEMINNLNIKVNEKRQKERIVSNLIDLLDQNEKIDLVPAKCESFKKAVEIKNQDNRLDDTDILIIAQALCDPYSSHLLINDSNILESRVIDEVNTNMHRDGNRNRKLRIIEEI